MPLPPASAVPPRPAPPGAPERCGPARGQETPSSPVDRGREADRGRGQGSSEPRIGAGAPLRPAISNWPPSRPRPATSGLGKPAPWHVHFVPI
jgi:hypothetical protein